MLSFAHDFEAGGIYYKITSSSAPYTVAVTYQGTSYYQYDNEYTGAVNIPATVTYNGKTYSVTSIGDAAFSGCSGLTSVTIPNSVTSIGDNAFYNCSNLATVEINSNAILSKNYTSSSSLKDIFGNQVQKYVIGNDVTSIGSSVFYGCTGLTSVTIPNSVTSIGDYAFYNCSGLTSVTIPNSVTTIGDCAFYNCCGLTSVTIPNSVTSIGGAVFCHCSSLTSVTIGNSVTSIGNGAFIDCRGLTSVTIPNSVTTIGESAFLGCSSLTSVTIGNSVTSIGNGAFENCSGLTSVTIPNSVTTIGEYAFGYCNGMTSVTIGNSVTSIGNNAFNGCSDLTSVTIGISVASIGGQAFCECSGLKKVIVPDIAAWCKITFGYYYANPLYYAHHIYSDEDNEITDLVIPNSVTSIGNGAFENCSDLTSVTIPNSVTSIGNYAFAGCTGLTSIISYIKEPFAIDSYCWYNVDNTISVYVPAGTKEQYQNTDGWDYFTNFIEFGAESIEPAEEAQEVDMRLLSEQIGLDGVVIGDTYYNIDTENGDNYDTENGCIILKTATTDEDVQAVSGLPLCDDQVKATFKGIIFMVPAGTGTVSINAETLGTSSLKVKIGSQAAQAFLLAERETVEIPYNVAEPTYVYIYAGTGTQAARSVGAARAAAAENSVKVYSYKWEPTDPTGINSVDNSQSATGNEAGDWYTIDGRKLSGKPAQKGIYIVNGRKVAVK